MRGAIDPAATRVRQGGDVPPIGLNAAAAMAIHHREIRIGHHHFVAERLQVLRDPLTLGGRLEQDAHARPAPEHRRQAFTRGGDPSVDDFTTRCHDPNLAFLLVQVDGTIFHGWSSPCASRARSALWSASYHRAEEHQPLHPIYGLAGESKNATYAICPQLCA